MMRVSGILSVGAMVWSAAVIAGPITQPQAGQQVRGELYGNNKASNPPLYGPQSEPLPSESLLAIQRSGVLPSELRYAAESVGPLAPNGVMSYLPAQSAVQQALRSRPANLWGPAYGPQQEIPSTGTPAPTATVPGDAGVAKPGIEPAPQYIPPTMIQPQAVQSGYRLSNDPSQFRGEGITTVRMLPRTHPATQPATQPSPGDQR